MKSYRTVALPCLISPPPLWYHMPMTKRSRIILSLILCALLCLAVYCAIKRVGSSSSAGRSVHMTEFNKSLSAAASDDDYRTAYEIFVYSFCDSNNDGIGDLNGVRSKLDYIADLGFDAIWLTPVHPSATYHKYDPDDYYGIDPSFGTMEDYEALIRACHEKGIRIYLDLVLNHTSDEHEWFRQASDYLHELPSGWEPDTSYCRYFDYYNFSREPAEGYTHLDGSEWYYEARFWSEMPDLNLRSDAVKDEIRNIMAFWLGKGVDGFRLDAVTSYFANDNADNAEFLRFLSETARSIDPDCYIVGEAWTDMGTIASLYSSGIDSLFDFPFAGSDGVIAAVLNGSRGASDYVQEMIRSEELYGNASPAYIDAPFYTNHDMSRSAEYYGENNSAAKMAYAMDLFMTGSAFVYYGEELGMNGTGKDENYRAPMHWSDDSDDPDMCAGPPAMDHMDMSSPSLADQLNDELSMHRWFTEVIRVRNAFPVIARGRTQNAEAISDDKVAAFCRRGGDGCDVLIVMNLSDQTVSKDLSAEGDCSLAAVLNTNEERITCEDDSLIMPAYSIAIFTLD